MLESGQNWELFGYDMRNVGRHWLAAWRELLFGYDSPLRRRLDETVRLVTPEGEQCYHAGRPVAAAATDCEAVLLPDDLVLARTLILPRAAEAELDAVLALEVTANSPFPADDTGFGWQVLGRDDDQLRVQLDIVSLSSVMTYLANHYDRHDVHAQEVWVREGEVMVVLRGFGEQLREGRYRRRLVRTAATGALALALLLVLFAAAAGFKGAELSRMDSMAGAARQEASEASRMRGALSQANATVAGVNTVLAGMPSPHVELARLTALLGDDVSIQRLRMEGREITLRGRTVDAAAVMQLLIDQPQYVEVVAPGAITLMPGTNLETFQLEIRLAPGGEA